MHPVAKMLILITVCQVLQTSYTMRRLHAAHAGFRWWLEMLPLMVATFLLVWTTLRILDFVPYLGI